MNYKGLIRGVKSWLGKPIATPESDPNGFFGNLSVLPNPDPILRAMGKADLVYASILADGHVIGDVRSIRGEFRAYDYRVVSGNEEDPKAEAARELCHTYLASYKPNDVADWLEVMWQMTSSILTGYKAHEPVWDLVQSANPILNGKILPIEVLDRPNRRYTFDQHGGTRLLSVGNNWQGELIEPYQAIVSRHMATTENPYGQALLSSCFWPWTFKTGGWRFFVKYCERHGLPWPIGRYPQGTLDKDIDKLAEGLAEMLESGYAVVPEGTGIELLVPNATGSMLPQENLIDRCNREMSKALTGQAMTAELQGVGARAAGQVAAERQASINDADRDIAAEGMHRLFSLITLINFGPDVPAPRLEFFKQEAAGLERAEVYDLVRKMGARPSMAAMLDELSIPMARDDQDALLPDTAAPPAPKADPKPPAKVQFSAEQLTAIEGWTFAQAAGMTEAEAIDLASQAADSAIEQAVIAPIYQMLTQYERDGRSLAEFAADLGDIVGELDDAALRDVLEQAMQFAILRGAVTNAD